MEKKIIVSILIIALTIIASYFVLEISLKQKEQSQEKEIPIQEEQLEKENFEFDEEKLASYLKENNRFFEFAFGITSMEQVEKDFFDTSTRLDFIRVYNGFQKEKESISLYKKDEYRSKTFMKEEDIRILNQKFFEGEIHLENTLFLENYYNLDAPLDGGIPMYYPMLHKIEEVAGGIYKITLIDYRSIDKDLKDYLNILSVDDIGNASTLEISVKIEQDFLKIINAKYEFKEDLEKYNSVDYLNKYKEFITMSNNWKYSKDILTNKNELSRFIKDNGGLLALFFEIFRAESLEFDGSNVDFQKNVIKNYLNLNPDNSQIYSYNFEQPTADIYASKDFIHEIGMKFFENFDETKLNYRKKMESKYYNVGTVPSDFGYSDYYPVFHEAFYNEEDDVYTLKILNYKDIGGVADYSNVKRVTKKELEEKGLIDIPYLEIKYKKKGNQRILLSSKFVYSKSSTSM